MQRRVWHTRSAYRYGLCSYGLYSYGLRSYGLFSYMVYIVMAYNFMVYAVIAYMCRDYNTDRYVIHACARGSTHVCAHSREPAGVPTKAGSVRAEDIDESVLLELPPHIQSEIRVQVLERAVVHMHAHMAARTRTKHADAARAASQEGRTERHDRIVLRQEGSRQRHGLWEINDSSTLLKDLVFVASH